MQTININPSDFFLNSKKVSNGVDYLDVEIQSKSKSFLTDVVLILLCVALRKQLKKINHILPDVLGKILANNNITEMARAHTDILNVLGMLKPLKEEHINIVYNLQSVSLND
jgi:hypothetical protein